MPEIVEIALSDLLLDGENARLAEEQDSQPDIALSLADQQGSKLINLASDIVDKGLDPSTLPIVVPTGDQKKRYRVLEGNRRVLALKALETPGLISDALTQNNRSKLYRLSEAYAADPIAYVPAVLFDEADQAEHWIRTRHTGLNEGVGLAEWGSEEKDRFESRKGKRSVALQVLDFVKTHGYLSDDAEKADTKISTSLKRLLGTPDVRNALGVKKVEGRLYATYPLEEVAKSLTRVVDDLLTRQINVTDIYHANQRLDYISSLDEDSLPKPDTALKTAQALDDLTMGVPPQHPPPTKKRSRRKKRMQPRTALIPKDCDLDVSQPRTNAIYVELLQINIEEFPNAVAVLLRVFLELSVDHYCISQSVMSENEIRNAPLAKRIKEAATHLKGAGTIDAGLEKAMQRVADGSRLLAASTVTFNQYVHNAYAHPSGADLRSAWDELQPFMEALWPPRE